MGKSIKRNFFYNVLLNISKVIFPLITAPYISRVLEPDGVGLFNFANTYAGYFALFAALGIPYYGVREIAKVRDSVEGQTRFVSEIMSLLSISTVVCVIAFLGSLVLVPQLTENHLIFIISALALYTTPLRIDWYFSGREEFGYITFRSLVVKTLSVVALFVFVHEKSDLIIYVFINALSTIINELWNFWKMYQHGIRPYFTLSCTTHLRPLLVLFSSSVAISIYTMLDTLMLGFMTDYSEVGFYNNATHISKNLLPIVTSLAAVAMPRLSNYMKNGKWDEIQTLIDKSFAVVSFLCFPVAFGVIAIAPTFVPLFYGELYYGTILPLQIIVLVVVAIGLNNLSGVQILVGLGHDKLFLYSVLIGMVTNFLLNLTLIPNYGAVGASIASVIAETLILFVTSYFVTKRTTLRITKWLPLIQSLILSTIMLFIPIPLSYLFDGWILIFSYIIVGGCFYLMAQHFLRNPAVLMFENVIIAKIEKKNR